MFRLKRDKSGTTGACRISSVVIGAWLIFSWSCPAFPDESPHLKLAPIEYKTKVGGNIGYTFQRNTSGDFRTTQQMLDVGVTAGITARSYFWKPWLSRIFANLIVGTSTNTTSSNAASTTRSGNTTITGDTILQVLPHSRFPFNAHAYRSNNQTNGFLSNINSDYINTGYDLSQAYRSKDGRLDSMLSFNHGTNGRVNFGPEDVSNQLHLSLLAEPNHSFQTFRVAGDMSKTDHPYKGDKSLSNTFVVDHSYQPNSELSVASFINLVKTGVSVATQPPQQQDFNSQQLSSISSWRPEGSPLTMTASARIFRTNSSSNGVTSPTNNDTNLNLGANYAWSPLLRMYGSLNVNDNNGTQNITTNANLSAQRGFGDKNVSDIGGFRYSRSVGASMANTTTTTTAANQVTTTTSVQSLAGNIGHDLSKVTKAGSGLFKMDINQGLSTGLSTAASPRTHLNTGGSLSLSHPDSKGFSMIRLSAIDSRDLSNPQKYFQMINVQATHNENVGRDQSLTGNLTLQGSRSGDKNRKAPFTAAPSADITYLNLRLFRKKNLSFNSTLSAQGSTITSSHDPVYFTPTQPSVSWDNNLDYFIGRLQMQLRTHIAEIGNTSQSSILFKINRTF